MNWWLESKTSGAGIYLLETTFAEACYKAMRYCGEHGRWCVYDEKNKKVAEVNSERILWAALGYKELLVSPQAVAS